MNFEKPNQPVTPKEYPPYDTSQVAIGYDTPQPAYHDEPFYGFRGRIGRLRYLAYTIVMSLILYGLVSVVGGVAGLTFLALGLAESRASENFWWTVLVVLMIAFAIVGVYVTLAPIIRRLHDMNRTGWWSLLGLVPYVNGIFVLFLIFVPGTDGVNDYGVPARPPTTRVKIVASLIPAIMIIGILAAIALPVYQNYVSQYQAM